MVRKKVEGITLDLTRIPDNGVYVVEDLIVEEIVPLPPAPKCPFPEWLEELYKNPCSFCGIKQKRMHFDHINMFEKGDSVSTMSYRGCSKEEIMAELNKCQLLCLTCHDKVTSMERKYGFMRRKRLFNKILRTGCNVEEMRITLQTEYMARMEGVYGDLRRRGKEGGHAPSVDDLK